MGFCGSVAGDEIVRRGDYRILQSEDDRFINPSQFSGSVRPGMTVEMSIVVREQTDDRQDRQGTQEHRCPRCKHINQKVITRSGWVSW